MSGSVIVAGARTPIGRLLGGLKTLTAADLGGVAIKGALDKAGVAPEQVDYLIMGQVIQAGAGQNPARTAGIAAGLPMSLPSITINKVCLSGVNAIASSRSGTAMPTWSMAVKRWSGMSRGALMRASSYAGRDPTTGRARSVTRASPVGARTPLPVSVTRG